jgi:hypothetical protein
MTPDRFVKDVVTTIVDGGVTSYKGTFAERGEVTDAYWRRVLDLYRSLPRRQKRVMLDIMRQVEVDTLSHVFGILDGSSQLGGRFQDFELFHRGRRGARTRLDGDLQDLFLNKTENG